MQANQTQESSHILGLESTWGSLQQKKTKKTRNNRRRNVSNTHVLHFNTFLVSCSTLFVVIRPIKGGMFSEKEQLF